MRISLVLSFIVLFHVHAIDTYSQDKRLNVAETNISLRQLFKTIEKQSEFLFFFVDSDIDGVEVTVNAREASVASVLGQALSKTGLVYEISNRNITISPDFHAQAYAKEVQQGIAITGKVTDAAGEPMPGVNVTVKGTVTGTVTNLNGEYTVNVPNNEAVISFSFIGYVSQEISAGNHTTINVTLEEDTRQLEEVVVIGYGTQKKVNLTGSVATVSPDDLKKRPVVNTTTALQGKVPGLQIVQGTGMPGLENPIIRLRGQSSWGTSSNPLILIDGVVGSLAGLPASDIENISVLKDAASASIYGARASNGVILITTKQGKTGKPVVSFDANVGWQSATAKPDQIWNSVDYMTLYNKAITRGTMSGTQYGADVIAKYSDPNRDKNKYPDFNWADAVFRSALQQTYNLGINGGSEQVTYNASVGYLDQEGILIGHSYKRYNGLVNLNIKINNAIRAGVQGNFLHGTSRTPGDQNHAFVLMTQVHAPMYGPFLPDGSGRYTVGLQPKNSGGNRNPFWIANDTYQKVANWQGNLQGWVDVDLFKRNNMTVAWSTKAAARFDQAFKDYYAMTADNYYWFTEDEYTPASDNPSKEHQLGSPMGIAPKRENKDERTLHYTVFSTLSWDWSVAGHDFGAIAGYSQELYNFRWVGAYRNEFPVKNILEIDALGTTGQSNSGGYREWTMRSAFGRINYAFKSKYLLEANFRYDATSYFAEENRGGFFPSASAAWRISEENFVKDNIPWLSHLKIRGSYGILGNCELNSTDYYWWQEVYATTTYTYGTTLTPGAYMAKIANREIQWEDTKVTDVGIDLNIFTGLFTLTADWYSKYTSGILADASLPASAGMTVPKVNYGELKNYGVEFELGHNYRIGEVQYGINGQISINRNKVMKYPAPSYSGRLVIEEGKPYQDHYLYEYTGVLKTQAEIDAITAWPAVKPQIGDFKLKDQLTVDTDGDGVPDAGDGKITADGDRVRMKGRYPDFIYSFGGNVAWKGWDMSFFFQGVQGVRTWTHAFGKDPFAQGSSPNPKFLNAFDPVTNPDSDIPSIYGWQYAPTTAASSYHLNNSSYLRLKNIQVGYTIPKSLTRKIGIDQLRIYFSGDNLLTFTDYQDLDPERADDGWHTQFPQLKIVSFGLNLKF